MRVREGKRAGKKLPVNKMGQCWFQHRSQMQASVETIWESAQQSLRTILNPDIYNLWFLPVKAVALQEDTIVLEVANDFCEVWLKDNYLGLIRDVLAQASGQILKIKFRVGDAPPLAAGPDGAVKAKSEERRVGKAS